MTWVFADNPPPLSGLISQYCPTSPPYPPPPPPTLSEHRVSCDRPHHLQGAPPHPLLHSQSTGCRVTGLTISKEQLSEATARVKAAGLEERVTLLFCDYRDCPGGWRGE